MTRRCKMQTYDVRKALWYLAKYLDLGGNL